MTVPATGVETPQGTPAPAPAAGQAAAPAQPHSAAPAKPAEQGQKVVPISALHEERDRRQASEAKSQEMQAEIDNLKNLINQYPQQQSQYQQSYQQPQQYQPNPYQVNPNPYQAPYQQQQPVYQQAPQQLKEQIDALWQEDIRKGMQAEMMAMMQYRDWVDAKVDQEFEASRNYHKSDFSHYENQVRSYIRSLPADARSQPNIVEAAYLMVKGQNADAVYKQREAALMQKFQGGQAATGMTGAFGSPGIPDGQSLNQDEVSAAQALGMTVEDYLKWRG